METLVLNRNFYAVQITDWKRAITLLFMDLATVVDEDYRVYDFETWKELSTEMDRSPQGFVHTAAFRLAVPDVIALKHYDKLPPLQVKFTRRNIYEHYDYRCCYCGERFKTDRLNLDHVVPRSRSGRTDWTNVVTACIGCNTRKANKLPEEANMALLIKPSKPRWRGPMSLMMRPGVRVRASWQKFIDSAYWNSELKD